MKKLLISFIFCLSYFFSVGQVDSFPVKQPFGSPKTLVNSEGAIRSHFINFTFPDTTTANTLSYLKWYNGAQIITTTGGVKIWFRYNGLWNQISGGGSSDAWLTIGNPQTDSLRTLGTTTYTSFKFISNNIGRVGLSRDGILPQTSNSIGLGRDTSTGWFTDFSAGNSYFRNAGIGDTAFTNPSTDHFLWKSDVWGYGLLSANNTDTTKGAKIDTFYITSRLRAQHLIDSLAATIAGSNQTPWTSNINAAHYGLDSNQYIYVQPQTGTPGTNTYALWNTTNSGATGYGRTLSNTNHTITYINGFGNVGGVIDISKTFGGSGKFIIKLHITAKGGAANGVGIMEVGSGDNVLQAFAGQEAHTIGWRSDGNIYQGNVVIASCTGWTDGDNIWVAVDLPAGELKFFNGLTLKATITGLTGTWVPIVSGQDNTPVAEFILNAGDSPLGTLPAGGWSAGWYTSSGGGIVYTDIFLADSDGVRMPNLPLVPFDSLNKIVVKDPSTDFLKQSAWPTATQLGGVGSLAAIGNTPNANGATISAGVFQLQPTNGAYGGVVTTGAQTLGGVKSFTSVLKAKDKVEFGQQTYAVVANSDTVRVSGYGLNSDASFIGGTGLSTAPGTTFNFIDIYNLSRIRQAGTVYKVRIHPLDLTSITAWYFTVWRSNGLNYDLVGSVNILSQLITNTTTIATLSSGINVLPGDFVGCSIVNNSIASCTSGATTVSTGMYYTTATPSSTNYNWSLTTGINFYVPIQAYVTAAPIMQFIGNSIMMGTPWNNSFLISPALDDATKTIPYKVATHYGYTYQNMGIGGEGTDYIQPRFKTDVTDEKPIYAVFEGGVNDIYHGQYAAQAISNLHKMTDSCIVNGIIPVFVPILPWTNGTNTQNMSVDTINLDVIAYVRAAGGIVADARTFVGTFRSGGTAGNHWDIQTTPTNYDYDGVHFTVAGYTAISNVIIDSIDAYVGTVPVLTIDNDGSGNALLSTTNSANILLDASGYVGVKNLFPTQALDVTGNVKFSGALMPNNASGTSGNFLQSAGAGSPPIWTSTVAATSVPLSGITRGTAFNNVSNSGNAFVIDSTASIVFFGGNGADVVSSRLGASANLSFLQSDKSGKTAYISTSNTHTTASSAIYNKGLIAALEIGAGDFYVALDSNHVKIKGDSISVIGGLPTGAGTKAVRINANGRLFQADTTVSGIIRASADLTAQTSTTNIATYTNGATDGSFNVSAYADITAVSAGVLTITCTYTDTHSNSRTATFYGQGTTTAGLSATGSSSFAVLGELRVKASTAITVVATLTIGTATFDASATITQLR